jgi:hypothetical protein
MISQKTYVYSLLGGILALGAIGQAISPVKETPAAQAAVAVPAPASYVADCDHLNAAYDNLDFGNGKANAKGTIRNVCLVRHHDNRDGNLPTLTCAMHNALRDKFDAFMAHDDSTLAADTIEMMDSIAAQLKDPTAAAKLPNYCS